MTHQGTKELASRRLILRRLSEKDAHMMFRNWAGDPQVTRYLSWTAHENLTQTQEVLRGWEQQYNDADFYHWGIVPDLLGEPIGTISVVKIREQSAELGYCIGSDWWHQGYTTEALRTVLAFLFEQVGFQSVTLRHAVQNGHSGDVAVKCGMKCIGTEQRTDPAGDGPVDLALYRMTAEEYRRAQ